MANQTVLNGLTDETINQVPHGVYAWKNNKKQQANKKRNNNIIL